MRILVAGVNYFPEITSTGLYTTQMCEWLAARGHNVDVITAFPFYPEWKIYDEYKEVNYTKEKINEVNVFRSYIYVPKHVTSRGRVVHEISFGLSSVVNLVRQIRKRPELVISISPPFQLGLHGYLLSRVLHIPFICHIQDLQIDAAADLKMIKNKVLLNSLRSIEKFLLTRASLVTTVSIGMREKIISKGINSEKVSLFPNWADIHNIKPRPRINDFRLRNGIASEDFLILYAGNLGEKQGLDTVLEAANILRGISRFKFYFVGDGARREHLINKAKSLGLKNINFLDIQPKEMLSLMLSAADICLVPQKDSVTDIVMPSKLTNIFASGRPVLVSASPTCEVSKVVAKYECGVVIEPENFEIMAEAILKLSQDEGQLKKMGYNGRKYSEAYLDMNKILEGFEEHLFKIIQVKDSQSDNYMEAHSE